MRTIVDIPAEDLEELTVLSKAEHVSRAALIRRAVERLLRDTRRADAPDAFGLWRKRKGDGLAYEDRMRSEWDR